MRHYSWLPGLVSGLFLGLWGFLEYEMNDSVVEEVRQKRQSIEAACEKPGVPNIADPEECFKGLRNTVLKYDEPFESVAAEDGDTVKTI